MSKIDKLHEEINNIEYRKVPHEGILNFMTDNKLIVIQGQSDDILDMYGFRSEEFSARDGFSHKDYECEDFQREEFEVLKDCEIEMLWCPGDKRSWLVQANDKYNKKEFNVMEDGEVYCTGLIIDLSKVIKTNGGSPTKGKENE